MLPLTLPDEGRLVLLPVDPKLYGLALPMPVGDVDDRPVELSNDDVGPAEVPLLEPL